MYTLESRGMELRHGYWRNDVEAGSLGVWGVGCGGGPRFPPASSGDPVAEPAGRAQRSPLEALQPKEDRRRHPKEPHREDPLRLRDRRNNRAIHLEQLPLAGARVWKAVERHPNVAAKRGRLLNALETLEAFCANIAFKAEFAPESGPSMGRDWTDSAREKCPWEGPARPNRA